MAAEANAELAGVTVVGFWNPAILTPPWLIANVFPGVPDAEPVPTELSMRPGQPPRYIIRGVRITPGYDRLTITPTTNDVAQMVECEAKARMTLLALPHTPISGVGINFGFIDSDPLPAVLGLFGDPESLAERTNLDFQTEQTSVTRAMAMNGYVLNFTRSLAQGNQVTYKFNFHYQITEAAGAAAILDGAAAANYATAQTILAAYAEME